MTIITYYYNSEENVMTDDNGKPIFDIFRIISPSRYYLFKEVGDVEYIKDPYTDIIYEFIYPEHFAH